MEFFFDNKFKIIKRFLSAAFLPLCMGALYEISSPLPANAQQRERPDTLKAGAKDASGVKRYGETKNFKAAPAVKKSSAGKYAKPAARIIDQEFEKEILNISFFEGTTDEVEYRRIYTALADDTGKLKEALKKAIESANGRYSACLEAVSTGHKSEVASVVNKIKENRDPARAESLASMLSAVKQDHLKFYGLEANQVRNTFDGLFNSFLTSYDIQKKFLISNTAYDSGTSEISIALAEFEKGIKNKNAKIQKHITDKFNNIVNGANYGDK